MTGPDPIFRTDDARLVPAVLSGPALHSGAVSTVRAERRAEDGLGLRFYFPGFPAPVDAHALRGLRRSAHRATVLEHASGATVHTPEHLLAAALFFADEPLDVFCDNEEPPGSDGSAQPWFDLFAQLAPGAARAPRCREYDSGLTWNHTGHEGALRSSPAPRFSVTCTVERGSFRETFQLENSADAPAAILPARTFIFWSDWRTLSGRTDLLAGAGAESGLLLAESPQEFDSAHLALGLSKGTAPEPEGNTFPLLHPRTFRMEAETARHKILDLLGDLALHGLALPKLHLEIHNGGHALNHLLLDQLQRNHSEASTS